MNRVWEQGSGPWGFLGSVRRGVKACVDEVVVECIQGLDARIRLAGSLAELFVSVLFAVHDHSQLILDVVVDENCFFQDLRGDRVSSVRLCLDVYMFCSEP